MKVISCAVYNTHVSKFEEHTLVADKKERVQQDVTHSVLGVTRISPASNTVSRWVLVHLQ